MTHHTGALAQRGTATRPWQFYAAAALGGSLLLAASASVRVPMWPVPMTMQTLVVLLLGTTLGLRGAVAATLAYLIEAACGLPVLTGGQPLLAGGPTFGYAVGFLPAAALVGWAADRGWTRRPLLLAAAGLAGLAVVFLFGLAWLHVAFLHDAGAALRGGLLPFLPGEAVKLVLAVALLTAFRPRRRA